MAYCFIGVAPLGLASRSRVGLFLDLVVALYSAFCLFASVIAADQGPLYRLISLRLLLRCF